ncbi:hypothetical protein G6F22_021951 [Rhizopus arrhizus]|nr:hypothetical protein G6F22_021951 [Rhizopus arrhizus]
MPSAPRAKLAVNQRRPLVPRSCAAPHCSFSNWDDEAGLPAGAGISIAMPARSDSIDISTEPPFWYPTRPL